MTDTRDVTFNGYWDVYFMLRLHFDDPTLQAAFSSPGSDAVQGNVRAAYDVVLGVENGRLIREGAGPGATW